MTRPPLVFIGFMGAGKSTAAREPPREARAGDDRDRRADRAASWGCRSPQAFERDGEEAFRAREAEVVGSLLERADGGAIALGGGTVLSERVREALGRHIVVWLDVDAEEAWRADRRHRDRPLARSAEEFARLLAERAPLYEALADAVLPVGRPRHRSPAPCRRSRRSPSCRRGPGCSGRPAPRASTRSTSAAACSAPAGGRSRAGALLRQRPHVAAALRRAPRPLAARVEVEPGEGARRWRRPSASCARWPARG